MWVKAILQERRLAKKNPDVALRKKPHHTPIAVKVIEEAETAILRFIQNQKFANEVQGLLQDRQVNEGLDHDNAVRKKTTMRRTSHIYRLDPFIAGELASNPKNKTKTKLICFLIPSTDTQLLG